MHTLNIPSVTQHWHSFKHSSYEPSELSQWLCYDDWRRQYSWSV